MNLQLDASGLPELALDVLIVLGAASLAYGAGHWLGSMVALELPIIDAPFRLVAGAAMAGIVAPMAWRKARAHKALR